MAGAAAARGDLARPADGIHTLMACVRGSRSMDRRSPRPAHDARGVQDFARHVQQVQVRVHHPAERRLAVVPVAAHHPQHHREEAQHEHRQRLLPVRASALPPPLPPPRPRRSRDITTGNPPTSPHAAAPHLHQACMAAMRCAGVPAGPSHEPVHNPRLTSKSECESTPGVVVAATAGLTAVRSATRHPAA